MKRRRTTNPPPPFDYGLFWEDLIMDLRDPVFREQFIDATVQLQADYQEDMLAEELEMERAGRTHDEWKDCTGRKFYVHKRNALCDRDGCAIHNPTDHIMVDFKQFMREDKSFLIERICGCGIGHPDPDSARFIAEREGNDSIWIHGCCGCCRDTWPPTYRQYQRDNEREPQGWGPHVHYYEYGDDDNGHSGSFCRCGKEEPY